jgi:hypothetical protein
MEPVYLPHFLSMSQGTSAPTFTMNQLGTTLIRQDFAQHPSTVSHPSLTLLSLMTVPPSSPPLVTLTVSVGYSSRPVFRQMTLIGLMNLFPLLGGHCLDPIVGYL